MSNVEHIAWKSQEPSRLPVPYDLLYQIIALVDFETVKSFSLVNRDCRDASYPRLWKSFTISVDHRFTKGNYKLGLEFLIYMTQFILATPRWGHIQDLRVRLHTPIGLVKGGELMVMQGIDYLLEGIRKLPNLRALELHILVHQYHFVHALCGITFSPRLERFATNLHTLHIKSFDELFGTMRSIKSIRWMANNMISQPDRFITPLRDPLPNLTELTVWSGTYTALMCGSPVTHLTIHDIKAVDKPEILKHVQRSTCNLTHLEVHSDVDFARSPIMKLCASLVEHIPSLRYLKISHLSPPYNYREDECESLRILGDLPFLEEFVWVGGSDFWQGQLFEIMQWGGFANLRRATFSWANRYEGNKTKYFIKENGKAMMTEVSRDGYG